jgi:DNA-binding GntR family transcriptional regulator
LAVPSYRRLADALREQIRSGELRPGEKLPPAKALAAEYGMDRNTVIRALSVLEGEGLVINVRGKGTFVRERPVRWRQARDRFVYRDERGYYFDRSVREWVMLRPTEISTRPADVDVAALMGVEVGEQVLTRYRRLGPAGGQVGQISTSSLPMWVAEEIPQLGAVMTGAGGIYDLLEQGGHRPLMWVETVWSRMPTPEETATLTLDPGTPLLLIGRVTRSVDGRVVEVNITAMPGDRFSVGYQVLRSPEANGRNQG